MLCIDLTPLSEGIHHFELEAEAQALALDPERFKNLGVDVLLDYFKDRALVTLRVFGEATLECDRTAQLYDEAVEGTYRVLYGPPSLVQDRQGSEDDEYEEVRVLHPADRTIDLADVVRDTLLLSLPARRVAPGAEDVEIKTVFGAPEGGEEPSIDPRWEALRALRSGNGDTKD